ncbi:MAG: hypothetical protein ABR923_14630 [Terracidiphilus sp.]
MSKTFLQRIPFAKILIVLTVVVLLSVGLCGVSAVLYMQGAKGSLAIQIVQRAIGYELVCGVLSAVGIVVTAATWIVAVVVGNSREKVSQSQDQIPGPDDTKHDKKDIQ